VVAVAGAKGVVVGFWTEAVAVVRNEGVACEELKAVAEGGMTAV
jgi:hypothetical protein